jgi:hypothetical protein
MSTLLLHLTVHQGSFFRLQNTEGLTLVGLFMEGTTLTCLETYSDAKKRTLLCTVAFRAYFPEDHPLETMCPNLQSKDLQQ